MKLLKRLNNIPKKEDALAYLIANKDALLKEKRAMLKQSDPLTVRMPKEVKSSGSGVGEYKSLSDIDNALSSEEITQEQAKELAVKVLTQTKEDEEPEELVVQVVANTSLFMDSHRDVSLPDSWAKSIKDQGDRIPFLRDHYHSIEGVIADTKSVFSKDVSVKNDLGHESDVETVQALVFEIEPKVEYSKKVYNLYKNGKVNQHSIGLRYVNIKLAINDPDQEKAFELWEKYYPQLINKDEADRYGYFWLVYEQKIIECSAVLFGSNSLTPTLSISTKAEALDEPPESTRNEPQTRKVFNLF